MTALALSPRKPAFAAAVVPQLRVCLFGTERLVPRGADDGLARAWLRAPIAGRPLYQRLLEPLVGMSVHSVGIVGGRVGRLLIELLEEDPVFGIDVHEMDTPPVLGHDEDATLLLPGSGLLDLDLRHLVLQFLRASTRACEIDVGHGLGVRLLPPNAERPDAPRRFEARGRLRRVDTAQRLIDVARSALDRKAMRWAPQGAWEGGVLTGARTTMSPLAELDLSSALGAESAVGEASQVERCVRLGPGAIVGRHAYVCEGALITNAVILDDTFVAPHERIQGCVRWRDREIR